MSLQHPGKELELNILPREEGFSQESVFSGKLWTMSLNNWEKNGRNPKCKEGSVGFWMFTCFI